MKPEDFMLLGGLTITGLVVGIIFGLALYQFLNLFL